MVGCLSLNSGQTEKVSEHRRLNMRVRAEKLCCSIEQATEVQFAIRFILVQKKKLHFFFFFFANRSDGSVGQFFISNFVHNFIR